MIDTPYKHKTIFVFILICAQIILMSFFSSDGGMSADSANYLRFAMSDSMYVNDLFKEDGKSFFAVWPMGYPLLIKSLMQIIPIDVLIISKIVNILLIFLACIVISKTFPKNSYLYITLFLSDSFVRISYMTWSEVPFSVSMIILSLSLYQFYNYKNKLYLGAIIISAISVFLSRYIGLFVLAPIAITGLLLLYKKDYKDFILMLLCGLTVLILASLYLWINYLNVGSFTGIERIASTESNIELINRLLFHQLKEIKILAIIIIFYAIYVVKISNSKINFKDKDSNNSWAFFLLVGIIYWITIVIVRWNFHFDVFGNRLLAPATLLLSFAALSYLLQYKNIHKHINNILFIMVATVMIYHLPIKIISNNIPIFSKIWLDNKQRYLSLKEESIVIFSELDIIYYNINSQTTAAFPYSGNRSYKQHMTGSVKDGETLEQYSSRLCKETRAKHIYLDQKAGKGIFYSQQRKLYKQNKVPLHHSFKEIIEDENKNNITLIKTC